MWKVGTFVVLIGCAQPVDEITTQAVIIDEECPVWQCGSNSPQVAFRTFHEASELGLANAEGFRISAFVKDGVNYTIDVTDGHLRGTRGAAVIEDLALVDAVIRIDHVSGASYAIRIDGVGEVDAWGRVAGTPPTLQTYLLSWAPWPVQASTQFQSVCPAYASEDDALGMPVHYALLFEGDRIDAARKTVYATDPSWFNIGCSGHALAKLALSGHTHAGMADGFATTTRERQAMLKQIVADYCGTGRAFTVAGTPATWRDEHAYTEYVFPPTLEARWTSAGASCLDTPRAKGAPEFADLEASIAATCARPPSCTDPDPLSFDGAYAISATP